MAFFAASKQGLKLRVRLTPSARRDAIDGIMQNVDGEDVLKASVTQVPEGGKANTALIKLLAKQWKLAKSQLDVVQGQTSRNKVLMVEGDAVELQELIGDWARTQGLA
ncbi:DUF167 family protein [Magnetovibrio sp. PR-2]|uniref:DUF167 domain-containing protein n=1 Tax=Magnetovibrio sp. PR-2 TaxID=3120356 RepID=UPI002FCE1615